MPTYASNKKAYFDYEIQETLEAGLMLTGAEVKSVRAGQISLKGAYITFHGTGVSLLNAHISPYARAIRDPGYDPTQTRRVLLHQKEIAYLREKLQEKGLTAVPLSVYTKGRYIKISVGLARGKKHYDKRASIKKRETDREIRRQITENK